MQVSIIVAVYNVEKYLERCIDSLAKQTFEDVEVILVDDGSTDQSGLICDCVVQNHENFRVLHKSNGGLSDARNAGMQLAQGEYILFVDSDDWIEKDMVEKLYNAISSNNADMAISSYFIDYSNENYFVLKQFATRIAVYEGTAISEGIYQMDSRGMFNVVWNKLYKKSILQERQIFFERDAMPGEDLLFNCKYCKHINTMVLLERTLYHYMRQEEDSLAGRYRHNLFEKVQHFNQCRKELYQYYNMHSDEKYNKCYARTYVDYLFTCIPNIYRTNTGLDQQERRRLLNSILKNEELRSYLEMLEDKTVYDKLLGFLIKINNIYVANIILNILFFVRYHAYDIYRTVRKRVMIK